MMGKVRMVVVNSKGVLYFPYTVYKGRRVSYDTKPRKPINRTRECTRRVRQMIKTASNRLTPQG